MDLPAPDGPITAANSPCSSRRSTPRKAVVCAAVAAERLGQAFHPGARTARQPRRCPAGARRSNQFLLAALQPVQVSLHVQHGTLNQQARDPVVTGPVLLVSRDKLRISLR